MTTHPVRHITIAIEVPPAEVYAFASDPRNLPRWASGLSDGTVEAAGDEWVATAPMGRVRIRFAAPNDLGVADHDVTLESGETFHNAMRVVPNGEGSEVTFVLLRLPGVTDEAYEADANTIADDLLAMKRLLEDPRES